MRRITTFFLSLFFLAKAITAQEIMTPETLWKLGRVNLEDVSPDGSMVLYSVTNYNAGQLDFYMINSLTSEVQILEKNIVIESEGDYLFEYDASQIPLGNYILQAKLNEEITSISFIKTY